MTSMQALVTVLIAAVVTMTTRAIPFLLFPAGKKAPAFVEWLSGQLPRAVMAMLMVYCLKDMTFSSTAGWIPALAGVAVTALLHLWKRQMMLSIVGGTALYMVLIRLMT